MNRIVQANIDRFKLLLETETDPTKRAMLFRLLAEQECRIEGGNRNAHPCCKNLLATVLAPNAPVRRLDVDAFFVEASTQLVPTLRAGNISAWTPFLSITLTSRSASDGAIETGNHLSGSE